jgi:hypothetical protein
MDMTENKYWFQMVCSAASTGVPRERRRLAGESMDRELMNSPAGRQRSQVENNARNIAYVH